METVITRGVEFKTKSFLCSTVLLLVHREWHKLFNEPSRLFGMLAQPLLFLLVFGAGFHEHFIVSGVNESYASFFFPGILGLIVLFSSIYATLTLVEDKKCGFFRLVLVGPSGVIGALAGKIIATFSLGLVQSLVFLPLGYFLGLSFTPTSFLLVLSFLGLGSLSFSLIGVLFAWSSPSPSAFHALMSIILIPMWLLSGAMFPLSDRLFFYMSYVNPMAYLVAGLRNAFSGASTFSSFCALLATCAITAVLLIKLVKLRPIE